MKVVVDIPNWLYNAIMEHREPHYSQSLGDAIRDGTPLPKKALEQQLCDDCISREQAIRETYAFERYTGIDEAPYEYAESILRDLPSFTTQPKIGHWIKQTLSVKPFGEDTVLCDQCAFMTDKDNMYNYCPNCGAKMVESQESEDKE